MQRPAEKPLWLHRAVRHQFNLFFLHYQSRRIGTIFPKKYYRKRARNSKITILKTTAQGLKGFPGSSDATYPNLVFRSLHRCNSRIADTHITNDPSSQNRPDTHLIMMPI